MTAATNKQLLQRAFQEMAQGNSRPFIDLWADDFCWTVSGHTRWSRTYRGKQVVLKQLMEPLFANFATRYTNTAHRFIAEDDFVAVECQGRVTTKNGKPYNNTYCYICRLADGKLKELTEYMDTQLVTECFADSQ
ncbi:MAG TPA: nuclear transport factor 2 family protein [Planctomycetaceae bacterium]|nr:nuclear transport factor 2 family protein [Planctomycetaceae bacterium]